MSGIAKVLFEKNGKILLGEGDTSRSLPLKPLPEPLLQWFIQGRKAGFQSLAKGKGPGPLFSRHLPVVSTTSEEEFFTTRLAHKGVGLMPRPQLLDQLIQRYEKTLSKTRDLPPEDSLSERLHAASSFMEDHGSIDPRLLGSLEIFAGGTFDNLLKKPFASLLFTDPGRGYRSFQLDCAVQIIQPPDPRFRFLQLARGLFERDPFHVTQPGVHCGYLFWIVNIHDKTPHPVREESVPHKI